MRDEQVRGIILGFMARTLHHAAYRFLTTKRYQLLENTVDFYSYGNNLEISVTLEQYMVCHSMRDIPFCFQNEVLIDAVFTLSCREQDILFYKFFQCMTDTQIAELYHVSRQTITKWRLHALRQLRVYMEERGV